MTALMSNHFSKTQFIKCNHRPRFCCYAYNPLNKASVPCFSCISAEQRCSKTVRVFMQRSWVRSWRNPIRLNGFVWSIG